MGSDSAAGAELVNATSVRSTVARTRADDRRERQLIAVRERHADGRERGQQRARDEPPRTRAAGLQGGAQRAPSATASRRGGRRHPGRRQVLGRAAPPWPGQLQSPRLSSHICVRDAVIVVDIQEIE